MSVTFVHTADWQLGKPFARVEDDWKRSILQQERLAAVVRLGEVIRESGSHWLVVAGDMFDSPTASRAQVSAACAAVGALKVPVFVLPGNHDPAGEGGVWDQPFFQSEQQSLAPNLHVFTKPEPLVLDDAVLIPSPWRRPPQHESGLSHVAQSIERQSSSWGDRPRIVIAHGAAHGFADEDEEEEEGRGSSRLNLDVLPMDEIDYVALGDWHGMKQVGDKTWYPGTPEPDRFPKGDQQSGRVLVVRATRQGEPDVRPVATGGIAWHNVSCTLGEWGTVAALESQLNSLMADRMLRDAVRLELTGALGLDGHAQLGHLIERWQARLLRLRLFNRVRTAPSSEEVTALARRACDPLISRVAARLLETLESEIAAQKADSAEAAVTEAAVAGAALRELHLAVTPADSQ